MPASSTGKLHFPKGKPPWAPGKPPWVPGPPPWRPHSSANRWLLLEYAHSWVNNTFYIACTTDIEVHLWLLWTEESMKKHLEEVSIAGLPMMWDPRFCFVEYNLVEQNEPGDTIYHTFNFGGWHPCEYRWWLIFGTEEGVQSPSLSPIFTAHYNDYKEVTSLRHIDLTDKQPGGIIDHADLSVTPSKLSQPFTFPQFPFTPSAPPILPYHVSNKKYVDDSIPTPTPPFYGNALPDIIAFLGVNEWLNLTPYNPQTTSRTPACLVKPYLWISCIGNGSTVVNWANLAAIHTVSLAASPVALNHGFPVGLYLKRYLYNPIGGANTMYQFDLWRNTWALMANLPAGYTHAAYTGYVLDPSTNRIYAIGLDLVANPGRGTAYYDCALNTWTPLTNTPQQLGPYDGLTLVGDSIYINRFGGGAANAGWGKYNITPNTYSQLTDYGANGGNLHGPAFNRPDSPDTIILIHGPAGAPFIPFVSYYSISGDTWTHANQIGATVDHYNSRGYFQTPVPHIIAARFAGTETIAYRVA